MAWCALVRSWNAGRKTYDTLVLRIEDTPEPGCLLRLYDGNTIAAEARADSPHVAMINTLELARAYLKDGSINEDSVRWVQVS